MPGFDVLDPSLPIDKHIFLEASAGTGKTFAIEHLFTRLLLEQKDLEVDQILVVTFTKAATYDLKKRIRATLENTLEALGNFKNIPSYLEPVAADETLCRSSKKKLTRALLSFEKAAIFTIHGFCFHTLREYALETGISIEQNEENTSLQRLHEIVKDYLRTSITTDWLNSEQMHVLFQSCENSIDEIVSRIVKIVSKRIPIEQGLSFKQIQAFFLSCHQEWMKKEKFQFEKLYEDFLQLAPCFSGLCDRQKKVKESVRKEFESAAQQLVNGNFEEFPSTLLKFSPDQRLKKPLPNTLNYTFWFEEMQEKWIPQIKQALSPLWILSQLAEGARQSMEKIIEKEELVFFEDLITRLLKKVETDAFAHKVRSLYKAVLIDEFQDTDPKQWRLFSRLFLNDDFMGALYVVGDPKQSIYRFREADIYTYLKAKESFPPSSHFSLDRNFRSLPSLVEALNRLFVPIQDLFSLPKLRTFFSCPSVKWDASKEEMMWKDGKKSVHFCKANAEEEFFPFILKEIQNLHIQHQIPLSSCAVLVKDRFQAKRFQEYCEKMQFPVFSKKNRLLTESDAFPLLKELLFATLHPLDKNALKIVLGGSFFRWSPQQLLEIEAETVQQFSLLKHILESKGILNFFNTFMENAVVKQLWGIQGGEELYQELLQLVELIACETSSSDQILPFLEKLVREEEVQDKIKVRPKCEVEAIQLLTIHVSKGLEFDIVFPLGLMLSHSLRSELCYDQQRECLTLDESALHAYREELDAEKMRQFYVAVTRAKKRVYLPVLANEMIEDPPLGTASPMRIFLNKLLRKKTVDSYLEENSDIFSASNLESCEDVYFKIKKKSSNFGYPPISWNKTFSSEKIHSFTSLISLSKFQPSFENEERIAQEEEMLPSGMETGNILHKILEEIPFEWAIKSPLETIQPWVKNFLKNGILESWDEKVSEIVYQALHTPFKNGDFDFDLAQIDPSKIYREMEFLYPRPEGGFLKGFVDLFFQYQGKYYLIDWKSNYLGTTPEHYQGKFLENAMHEHDYYLQAKIYKEALERYLSLFEKEVQWGGIYYVFLRGLPKGIYKVC